MSKYSDLFKKIELFEKLAIYSNRSEFLQKISQNNIENPQISPSKKQL